MKNMAKATGIVAAGAMVFSALPLAQAAASGAFSADFSDGIACGDAAMQDSSISDDVSISHVQGSFLWDQEAVADNSAIRGALYEGASRHICGAQGDGSEVGIDAGIAIEGISVSGDVETSFVAGVDEYVRKAPVKKILGCTCAGNPADGRASANAQVEGFELAALIADANSSDSANAITFVSRDGYAVTLPLSYVAQRQSVIVTSINGENASDALGCQNQLWLGATSARMFVRDVVSIVITCEDEVPAAPGTDGYNQPNVGVISGEATA